MMVLRIKQSTHMCPECGGFVILALERGDSICKDCGLVVDEKNFDAGHSGVRAFTKCDQVKKQRTGSPITPLVPDISLSTKINQFEIQNPDFKRITKWNTHLNWESKNLLIAITELKRIASNLRIPKRIQENAVKIYKEILKKKYIKR